MHDSRLQGIDLNLLIVLRAILRAGSVTRAAEALGRSQSAMSHALARLRDVFDDELLVRVGNDMNPTALAERLRDPVDDILERAGQLFGQRGELDPAQLDREFRITSSDYGHTVVTARCLARVREMAPRVRIVAVSVGNELERAVQSGAVDLALGGRFEPLSGLLTYKLFNDDFVCAVRNEHPIAPGSLDLDAFVGYEHALVAPRGQGSSPVDDALAEGGMTRRVAFRSRHFLAALVAVADSDLIVTAPRRLAERLASGLGLRLMPPPLEVPGFSFGMVYSGTDKNDPAHTWLRQVIADSCRSEP